MMANAFAHLWFSDVFMGHRKTPVAWIVNAIYNFDADSTPYKWQLKF